MHFMTVTPCQNYFTTTAGSFNTVIGNPLKRKLKIDKIFTTKVTDNEYGQLTKYALCK